MPCDVAFYTMARRRGTCTLSGTRNEFNEDRQQKNECHAVIVGREMKAMDLEKELAKACGISG